MKQLLVVIALLIVAFIALRLFFWAAGQVFILLVVAAGIYLGVRLLLGKKRGSASGG